MVPKADEEKIRAGVGVVRPESEVLGVGQLLRHHPETLFSLFNDL